MVEQLGIARQNHPQTAGLSDNALNARLTLRLLRFILGAEFHRRLPAGHGQIDICQYLGIEQRAVQRSLGVVYFIARAKRIEAVTLAGEHLPRQRQAVRNLTEGICLRNITIELAELIVHKADIERRVVNDEFCASDVFEKFIRDVRKGRLIKQELIGNTVNAEGFRVHQPIGLEINMEVVSRKTAVHHLYGTDLNDLMPFVVRADLVHTGGFGIENNLASYCCAHSGHLCQTYRLLIVSNTGSLPEMRKQVEIFTDGSCLGNPGPGGYGAIMRYRQHEKTFSEGYFLTTNNRMELMAAIVALEALKEHCDVTLSTDSQYVRQGITQWIHNWKKRGWKTAEKKPVKNVDLWKRLDAALGQHEIKWEWVKGHAGHPENERCDELARAAASNPAHEDVGYQPES